MRTEEKGLERWRIERVRRTRAGKGGSNKLIVNTSDRPAGANSPTHDVDIAMLQTAIRMRRVDGHQDVNLTSPLLLHLQVLVKNRDAILSYSNRRYVEAIIGPAEVRRIHDLHYKDSTPWMLLPGNLPKRPPQAKKT